LRYIILLLLFNILFASSVEEKNLLYSKNSVHGCTIAFFAKQKPSCSSSKTSKKVPIVKKKVEEKNLFYSKDMVEVKLTKVLNSVKFFKKRKESETKKLLTELEATKQELARVKQALLQSKKKLVESKKIIKRYKFVKKQKIKKQKIKKRKTKVRTHIVKVVPKKKRIKKHYIKKRKTKVRTHIVKVVPKKKRVEEQVVIHRVIQPLTPHLKWVEVQVEENRNIYDLALEYYGDAQAYDKIYAANRDVIESDFQIKNGMTLKIPITERFKEQPIVLNVD